MPAALIPSIIVNIFRSCVYSGQLFSDFHVYYVVMDTYLAELPSPMSVTPVIAQSSEMAEKIVLDC